MIRKRYASFGILHHKHLLMLLLNFGKSQDDLK